LAISSRSGPRREPPRGRGDVGQDVEELGSRGGTNAWCVSSRAPYARRPEEHQPARRALQPCPKRSARTRASPSEEVAGVRELVGVRDGSGGPGRSGCEERKTRREGEGRPAPRGEPPAPRVIALRDFFRSWPRCLAARPSG